MTQANGISPEMQHALSIEERDYHCRQCGRWLMASNVPLGTSGVVRVQCPERQCSRGNAVRIGELPLPKPDREEWLRRVRPRTDGGTTF